MILQKYADDHHFFNTRFFVDDGVSGVSFEREGLQTMLREVEAGNVATVITKDLSRLGRNYLKTGELIEIIFPEYDVRYIAINDGVDTAREDNEFTPLRNWFKNKRCLGGGTTKGGFMNFQMDKLQVLLHTAFTRPDRQSGKTL